MIPAAIISKIRNTPPAAMPITALGSTQRLAPALTSTIVVARDRSLPKACTLVPPRSLGYGLPGGRYPTLSEVLHLPGRRSLGAAVRVAAACCLREEGTIPDREHLRAASRAVKHPVGQESHLGMSALAGMATQGVEQADYLQESLEQLPAKEIPAGSTAGRVAAEGLQLPCFAERADDEVRIGVRRRRPHVTLL